MIDWIKVRSKFPALREYCYLNSAEASPISNSSHKAATLYYDEIRDHGDTLYEKWLGQIEDIRQDIAQYINADPSEIAFTTNTSLAMNYISYMLKGQGDVLSMEDEFPSSTLAWLNNKYNVAFVKSIEYTYPIEHIEKHIQKNTKILVSSHIQYKTGFRQNIKALSRITRQYDKLLVINATQSFGVFPIDVREMGIDFLASTGLKWAMAGYGVGIIYISKQMQERYSSPICGWRSNKDPMLMQNNLVDLKNNAQALEVGCPNITPILALGQSIKLFSSIGQENITKRILELTNYAISKLKKAPIISPIDKIDSRSGIILVKLKEDPLRVKLILEKQNIIVSKRGEGIRISFHIYNTFDDIDRLTKAISPYL